MAVRSSALCFLIGAGAFAQADRNQRFEVASVRRVDIPANDRGVPVFPPPAASAPRTRPTLRGTDYGS